MMLPATSVWAPVHPTVPKRIQSIGGTSARGKCADGFYNELFCRLGSPRPESHWKRAEDVNPRQAYLRRISDPVTCAPFHWSLSRDRCLRARTVIDGMPRGHPTASLERVNPLRPRPRINAPTRTNGFLITKPGSSAIVVSAPFRLHRGGAPTLRLRPAGCGPGRTPAEGSATDTSASQWPRVPLS